MARCLAQRPVAQRDFQVDAAIADGGFKHFHRVGGQLPLQTL